LPLRLAPISCARRPPKDRTHSVGKYSRGAVICSSYRAGTRQRICGLSCRASLCSDFNLNQAVCHSSHTLLIQFLSNTTTPTGWPVLPSPGASCPSSAKKAPGCAIRERDTTQPAVLFLQHKRMPV